MICLCYLDFCDFCLGTQITGTAMCYEYSYIFLEEKECTCSSIVGKGHQLWHPPSPHWGDPHTSGQELPAHGGEEGGGGEEAAQGGETQVVQLFLPMWLHCGFIVFGPHNNMAD